MGSSSVALIHFSLLLVCCWLEFRSCVPVLLHLKMSERRLCMMSFKRTDANMNWRFFSFYGRVLARNSQPLVVVGPRRLLSCDGVSCRPRHPRPSVGRKSHGRYSLTHNRWFPRSRSSLDGWTLSCKCDVTQSGNCRWSIKEFAMRAPICLG